MSAINLHYIPVLVGQCGVRGGGVAGPKPFVVGGKSAFYGFEGVCGFVCGRGCVVADLGLRALNTSTFCVWVIRDVQIDPEF